MQGKFTIVDNDLNREIYPTLIGQQYDSPPAYAVVISERQQFERKSDAELASYAKVLLISVPEPMRAVNRRHRRLVNQIIQERRMQRAAA